MFGSERRDALGGCGSAQTETEAMRVEHRSTARRIGFGALRTSCCSHTCKLRGRSPAGVCVRERAREEGGVCVCWVSILSRDTRDDHVSHLLWKF